MVNIYCQGTSGGIIYISLTGGREGKIISEISPIYVYLGLFTEWKIQGKEFKTILDGNRDVVATPINKYGVLYSGIAILNEGENFYFEWATLFSNSIGTAYSQITANKGIQGTNQNTQLFSTPTIGESSRDGTPPYYYESDSINGYSPVMTSEEIDGIAIWNDQESLYTRRNYEGLNINYSVQCLNCSNGECAARDGRGGIICMDCEEISGNINAAIRSYK